MWLRRFCMWILSIFLCLSFLYSQKTETENGVRIVHNERKGKWGNNPKVSLRLIRTIGGVGVEDENCAFFLPQDTVMDSTANVYTLDYMDDKIQKFSSEGEYLKTIGESGQGPVDFNRPFSVDIDSYDKLYILDSQNRRIQILSNKGEYLNQIMLDRPRQNILRVLNSGLIALGGKIEIRWTMLEQSALPELIDIIDTEGNMIRAFGEMKDFQNRVNNWWGNWFYFDVDTEDNFYLSFTRQNRIEKYNRDGILQWRANRFLNYSTDVIKNGHIERPGGGTMIQAPEMNEVSKGISTDSKGRIWVLTLNRQFEPEEKTMKRGAAGMTQILQQGIIKKMNIYKLEIYDPNGILLGEIMLNHLADGIRIQKDFLFIWEVDNAKYYQYKVIEH